MIRLKNVSKIYPNGTAALKNIDLSVEKGEFVFIVGPSGAGKSTLMKLLLREEVCTSGIVEVNGYNLNKVRRGMVPKLRRSLGVVFQDFRLIPGMSVYDNVAFALRVTEVSSNDIRRRVPYILSLVGLGSKAKCIPEQLSGGEQQRVALARALVGNPSLIIADEPTGNIDPRLSHEIVELLNEISSECGTTVLMVTHEHELVAHFRRRVLTIDKGVLTSDRMGLATMPPRPARAPMPAPAAFIHGRRP